jgi:hypothetical protein
MIRRSISSVCSVGSILILLFELVSIFASTQTIGGILSSNDYDGDGVINSIDLEDDNVGILDSFESPFCFYIPAEWNLLDRYLIVKVCSQLTSLAWGYNFNYLTNGLAGLNGNLHFSTTPSQD